MPTLDPIKLPFAEAIEFFLGKLGNLIPTARWDEVMRAQHDRGFMVAGAAKADLLADFAAAVEEVIAEGKSIEYFRSAFDAIVAAHGWAYEGERNWRTRVIYQTNMSTAYAAGRLAQLRDPDLQQLKPLVMYKHNDSVTSPRPEHEAWDGITLPIDDPWWSTHYPPNDWGCFPGDTEVEGRFELGLKARYAGKMIEIQTGRGYRVSLTPNHPVLTARGWVRADEVSESDTVFSKPGNVDGFAISQIQKEHAITTAQKMFDALCAQGFRDESILPHDFDGDGQFMQRDINVVGSERFLARKRDATSGKLFGEQPSDGAHMFSRVALAYPSSFAQSAHAQMPTFHSRANTRGLGLATQQTFLAQPALNGPSRDAELCGDGGSAETPLVHTDDLAPCLGEAVALTASDPCRAALPLNGGAITADRRPAEFLRSGVTAQHNTQLTERSAKSAATDMDVARDALQRLATTVAADNVARIRKFDFCGHVYDFQTEDHMIITNGIVVHNCQCYPVAVSQDEAQAQGGRFDAPPDVIDPATGEPQGIGRGWGYAPGDTVTDDVRARIAEKAAALPGPLGDALRKDLDTRNEE